MSFFNLYLSSLKQSIQEAIERIASIKQFQKHLIVQLQEINKTFISYGVEDIENEKTIKSLNPQIKKMLEDLKLEREGILDQLAFFEYKLTVFENYKKDTEKIMTDLIKGLVHSETEARELIKKEKEKKEKEEKEKQ